MSIKNKLAEIRKAKADYETAYRIAHKHENPRKPYNEKQADKDWAVVTRAQKKLKWWQSRGVGDA